MEKWIKLLDKKPKKEGIYKTLKLSYKKELNTCFLLFKKDVGFQSLDYGRNDGWAINMNVTHWLEINEPDLPIKEAESLIIQTETFFHKEGLEYFCKKNNIELFSRYGNANEYIVSGVDEVILLKLRNSYKSNGTHFNVRSV
jgi:hypothetical protein